MNSAEDDRELGGGDGLHRKSGGGEAEIRRAMGRRGFGRGKRRKQEREWERATRRGRAGRRGSWRGRFVEGKLDGRRTTGLSGKPRKVRGGLGRRNRGGGGCLPERETVEKVEEAGKGA